MKNLFITILASSILYSCHGGMSDRGVTFYYICEMDNQSGVMVEVRTDVVDERIDFPNPVIISNNKSYEWNVTTKYEDSAPPFGEYGERPEKLTVIFNGKTIVEYTENHNYDDRNPLNLYSYSKELVKKEVYEYHNEFTYRYTYTFTMEDYDKALAAQAAE